MKIRIPEIAIRVSIPEIAIELPDELFDIFKGGYQVTDLKRQKAVKEGYASGILRNPESNRAESPDEALLKKMEAEKAELEKTKEVLKNTEQRLGLTTKKPSVKMLTPEESVALVEKMEAENREAESIATAEEYSQLRQKQAPSREFVMGECLRYKAEFKIAGLREVAKPVCPDLDFNNLPESRYQELLDLLYAGGLARE